MKVKTKTTNADWLQTIDNIENIVSFDRIKQLSKSAIDNVAKIIDGKNTILSYSAGKDSIVLEHLLRSLNIKSIMAYSDLEYPEFMKWVINNKPKNCTLINSGQDLEWLSKNQDMIFPKNSAIASKWYNIVQHRVQNKYIKNNNVECIILGRRNQDGNHCGTNGSYVKDGCVYLSPIYNWTHEDILAYIHYYNLELPPIYNWEDGYKQGTHNWASYILYDKTPTQALDRLYKIDKGVIIKAKDYIPFIKEYYESRKD